MRTVVPECMRVLKPTGSAVFVLQPNSERVGRMRTWLWEFMAWVGKEWGIVQDAWWWNITTPPGGGATEDGLLRGSLKACVWVGPPGCRRNQEAVLWRESQHNSVLRLRDRSPVGKVEVRPSARTFNDRRARAAAEVRGGVTPFNVLPVANNNNNRDGAGMFGHGAGTPLALSDFWVRYLCPPGGAVLDPFSGSGTAGLAALKHGCDYVGIEAVPEYHATACRRLAEAAGPLFATPPAAGVS